MTKNENNKTSGNPLSYWVKGYIFLTATAFALIGFFLVSTWCATRNSRDWWLGSHDPLLVISNRAMLVFGGLLYLGVAAYLFAARDLLIRAVTILWVGLNDMIYYAGVHLMEPSALPNTERFIGWRLQLQPAVVDNRWRIFQLYLVVTSIVALILTWHHSRYHSKQLKEEKWLKQWKKMRGEEPRSTKPASQNPLSGHSDFQKISCLHCNGHIEFPTYAIGQKCPAPIAPNQSLY